MMINSCKVIFSKKPLQRKKLSSHFFFGFLIVKKTVSSTVQLPNVEISASKKNILNSILKSEVSPFINQSELHLLTSVLNAIKRHKISYRFVINYSVAKDIVDNILPHIAIGKDVVVEANPGLGFITLCLIKSGVNKILILDKSDLPKVSLNQLKLLYSKNIKLVEVNLFKFPGLQITDLIEDSIRLNSFTKVIGVVSNNTFLINLMYTYIINELWNCLHYLEFFLVVGSHVWKTVLNNTEQKTRYLYHFLFNFLFKFEKLKAYQYDAFLPIPSDDKEVLTLVKITANLDLIKQISRSDLKTYIFFLQVLTRSKKTFVIPTLEKFVPNCGLFLISQGVSMSNILADFSPAESVHLFNIFKQCEGFEYFKKLGARGIEGFQFDNLGNVFSHIKRASSVLKLCMLSND